MLTLAGCNTNGNGQQGTTLPPLQSTDTTAPVQKQQLNIGVLKGPTGMGAAYLMASDEANETVNDYEFTIAGAPDVLVSQIVSGELDIAALPSNTAATLYNKSSSVVVAAVNTLGVLYVVQKGDAVKSVTDLKGKTVYSSGKGTTAEYVFNYILEKNGLKPGEDVKIEYETEHAAVVSKATAGQADIVLLPEPFVTSLCAASSDYSVALNLTSEWQGLNAGELPMGVIVVNKSFAQANPDAVNAFLTEYSASVNSTQVAPEAAAVVIANYGIMDEAVAKNALPRCNIVCLTGEQMKAALEPYYGILLEANEASVGGFVPDAGFYFMPAAA